jgi:putative endonuclease
MAPEHSGLGASWSNRSNQQPLAVFGARSFIVLMDEFRIQRGRLGKLQNWLARRRPVSLGRWGEWVALRYLLHIQYDVLTRNWTTRRGEADLVARDGETTVIVEVKTRRLPQLLPPEAAITAEKRVRLEMLALQFIQRYELDSGPVRVDLIAIDTPDLVTFELRHYHGLLQ